MVRVLCLLSLLCLLSACASTRPATPREITQVTAWKMWGRVVIHTTHESRSANFYWEQHDQDYHIDVFGLLGLGGVSLVGSPGRAELTDSYHHHYRAASPEALMQQQLGWAMPVSDLFYWVRRLPAPNHSTTSQDWVIYYDSEQSLRGLTWPKKMRIEAHDVSIIFIIHEVELL